MNEKRPNTSEKFDIRGTKCHPDNVTGARKYMAIIEQILGLFSYHVKLKLDVVNQYAK